MHIYILYTYYIIIYINIYIYIYIYIYDAINKYIYTCKCVMCFYIHINISGRLTFRE